MKNDTTTLFKIPELNQKATNETLKEVYEILEERGYNPVNQLVGYLMSGDPGYVSSYKEARNKITKLDRAVILEILIKNYIGVK